MSHLLRIILLLSCIIVNTAEAQLTWDVTPSDQAFECDDNGQTNTDILNYIATITATSACDPGGEMVIDDYADLGDYSCGDSFMITFDATDNGCSTPISETITVNIEDTEEPVVDISPSDLFLTCDPSTNAGDINNWLAANANATFSDDCTAVGSIVVTNDYSGTPPDCGDEESVTFDLLDECGNLASFTADITIDDFDAPSFNAALPDLTLDCNDPNNPTLLNDWFTDIYNNSNVSDVNDCTDANDLIIYDNYDGTLPACLGSEDVTFTVEDECGNTGTAIATIILDQISTYVSFIDDVSSETESNTTVSICLQIVNESPTMASDVEVTINGSSTVTNGTDITFINPVQNFQFPVGSSADICFNVEVIQDGDIESNEFIQFDITNVSGGDNASAGTFPSHTFTINDDDDTDGDGVPDVVDNCPDNYNPDQTDVDNDGIGNVCDTNNQVNQIVEFEDNLYMSKAYSGVILKSPNGSCYILVVDDNGMFQSWPVECP